MSVATVAVQQATIRQYAKDLKLATVGGQFLLMAEEAVKQKHGHLSYLEALLGAEVEDRYQHGVARRITEAHFPKVITLEDFAFSDAPQSSGHADPESGRGRLLEPQRAGYFSWRNRHG
jgi:DNA replication protein DnaC